MIHVQSLERELRTGSEQHSWKPGWRQSTSYPSYLIRNHHRVKSFRRIHKDSNTGCVLSGSVVSNSLQFHELLPSRLLCPWNFPGNNTGVSSLYLLQGILSTQGSNLHFLLCEEDGLQLSHYYINSLLSECSEFRTHVHLWWIHVNVWQNQYSIVK